MSGGKKPLHIAPGLFDPASLITNHFWVGVLIGFLVSAPLCIAQESWQYQYGVTLDSLEGQTWVALSNEGSIALLYDHTGTLSYEKVNEWNRGKPLTIAYNTEHGEVLIDPESGEWASIARGLEKQSIQRMQDDCLEVSMTTLDIAQCFLESAHRWDLEIQRTLDRLTSQLTSEQAAKVKDAQAKWSEYYVAETVALKHIHVDGSIRTIRKAAGYSELSRLRVQFLQNLLTDFNLFWED